MLNQWLLSQVQYYYNGYNIYVDIMTRENLLSIWVANMDNTYWSVCHPIGGEGM